jgi:hypothetical protein
MHDHTHKVRRIARYTLMLRDFLPGGDQDRFTRDATEAGLVTFNHKRNGTSLGGCSWYQATAKGCALVGAPLTRSASLSEASIRSHLAALWLANAYEPMELLEPAEAEELLGCPVSANVSYVAAKEGVIYRVYASRTNVIKTVQKARQIFDEMTTSDPMRPLVRSGLLGIAVLVETAPKASNVSEALRQRDAGVSLDEIARVIVRLYPSPKTLSTMLKAFRENRE